MDIPQIKQTLSRLFFEENNRLIFWHDPDAEFTDSIPDIDNVVLIRMDQEPALGIKIRIERKQPDQRFLLYSPTRQPEPETDWFLDCRYYSYTFKADRASIILDELGLKQQQLHDYIVHHQKFFANKSRLRNLQHWVHPDDSEKELSKKMIAVTVKSDQPEFNNVLLALFQPLSEQADLDIYPPVWDDLEKYNLQESFWNLVTEHFGYSEESPSLRNLLIRLFVTDFSYHLQSELPTTFKHFVLPEKYSASISVFLGQWRDSTSRNGSYDVLSSLVADLLKLTDYLHNLDEASLAEVMSFLDVEKQLCRLLRDHILDTSAFIQPDALLTIIRKRLDGYWCAKHLLSSHNTPRLALHYVYQALSIAIEFFSALNQCIDWQQKTPELQYKLYCEHHYLFDQQYRLFSEYADHARAEGWDILKDLRGKIEATYNEQVLQPLSLAWDTHLSSGLLDKWKISGEINQQNFYSSAVKPLLDKAGNRKVYVIISDAFRYEVANELTNQLNGKFRFQANLGSLLGVLPSYTALGMAALLPHQQLEYNQKSEISIDGQPCASLDQRSNILSSSKGCAIKADDFIKMKKDEGREFVRTSQVIYIYHNVIDAVGDTASTEADTFDAVRKTIAELGDLVRFIINSLNGTHVFVTADHGFIFQEKQPELTDKSLLVEKPSGTVKAKKRYLLGQQLGDQEQVWHGSAQITADAKGDMEFWLPKGCNRFHFVGGARFFHGGAMPQEFIVPLLKVQQLKGKSAEKTKIKTVPVHVLGSQPKITTNRHRFQLIQTESVSDRVKAVTLQVAIYDADSIISSIETVTFDSQSTDMNDRSQWVSLSLQGKVYDNKKQYHLILRNTETGVEEQRIEVIIDLAFSNDF